MSARGPGERIRLTLYGRSYCHLCEEMLAALDDLGPQRNFDLEVIDIDRDPQLEARYGELVPVLAHGETTICHYVLDRASLTAYLAAFR